MRAPPTENFTVRLTPAQRARLKAGAAAADLSVSAFLRLAGLEYARVALEAKRDAERTPRAAGGE